MKIIKYISKPIAMLFSLAITMSACDTEFENLNSPSPETVLETREGLINLAVGLRQTYSVSVVRWSIETAAIITRETAANTSFLNFIQLENGGTSMPNDVANIGGLFSNSLQVMKMSEDLAANTDDFGDAGAALRAHANVFKAMSIGTLAMFFEQVPIQTSIDGTAQYVSRMDGYAESISLLEEAKVLVDNITIPSDVKARVLDGYDLRNTIDALLARYYLFHGDYQQAIDAAEDVDQTVPSVFLYDGQNENPIWVRSFQESTRFALPQDMLGLPAAIAPEADDDRVEFYTEPSDMTSSIHAFPVELIEGFFTTPGSPIPIYLPGEMDLIIAEANVRLGAGNFDNAVDAINAVRTKTEDIFGVAAGLDPYTGTVDEASLLEEIYTNRRAELFMSGLSLEDSRRLGRPGPPLQPEAPLTAERTRNFLPYPVQERNNNPNTPADPQI